MNLWSITSECKKRIALLDLIVMFAELMLEPFLIQVDISTDRFLVHGKSTYVESGKKIDLIIYLFRR